MNIWAVPRRVAKQLKKCYYNYMFHLSFLFVIYLLLLLIWAVLSFFLLYHLYRYAEINLATAFAIAFFLLGVFLIIWISFNNLHDIDWSQSWDSTRSAQEFFN